jgi:hypothetical protein
MAHKFLSYSVATLILAIQLPVFTMMSYDRLTANAVGMFAIVTVLLLVLFGAVNLFDYVLFVPVAALCLLALPNWVNGYTEFRLAEIVAIWGVCVVCMRCDARPIMLALCLSVVVQAAIMHFGLIHWQLSDLARNDSPWGTFRQHIRYSTIMYAGMMGAWYTFKLGGAWRLLAVAVGVLALGEIVYSNSHTLLFIAWASAFALLYYRRNKVGMLLALAVAVGVGSIAVSGVLHVGITHGRYLIWQAALTHIFDSWKTAIIGHGPGAWYLHTGEYGFNALTHPHSSLLGLLYGFGLVGLLVMVWVICGVFALGSNGGSLAVAFVGLVVSTFTNSFMYPEIYFLVAIFAGLSLRGAWCAVEESCASVNAANVGRGTDNAMSAATV